MRLPHGDYRYKITLGPKTAPGCMQHVETGSATPTEMTRPGSSQILVDSPLKNKFRSPPVKKKLAIQKFILQVKSLQIFPS